MMTEPALNLNLATRPLRNRRLYAAAVRVLGALIVVLAGLSVFVVLKYGGETARLKSDIAATTKAQVEASREEKRLKADITREEKLSRARVDLVNGIIQRKMFSWTGFLTELEKSLPGPSYIMALSSELHVGREGRRADAGDVAQPGRPAGLHHRPDRPRLQGPQGRRRTAERGRPPYLGDLSDL